MNRIDRMTLRAFMGPFFMSVGIVIFILVLQFISLYLPEIMGKGLSPMTLGRLFMYAAGRVLLTAMPIGILTAGLMTFGSLGEHYELMALKSSGINLFRIMRGVLILTALITVGSIYLSFEVIPKANLKFFSLLYDVQRKKANLALKPGHFYSDIDGYVIRISDKSVEREMLYDVLIYNHTENRGNNDIIQADSAHMDLFGSVMRMTLYSGTRYEEYRPDPGKPNTYRHGRTSFDSLYYRFELKGFELDRTDEKQFRHQIIMPREQLMSALDSLEDLTVRTRKKSEDQLSRYNRVDYEYAYRKPPPGDTTTQDTVTHLILGVVESIELNPGDSSVSDCWIPREGVDIANRALSGARAVKSYVEFMKRKYEDQGKASRQYYHEFWLRWAMPISCLVFAMIGISLGAIIRKGGLGPPALVSIAVFVVYYVLLTYGKKTAQEGIFPPIVGAFLPLFIFFPMAVVFTIQAALDARLFNESSWEMWSERIRGLFRLRKKKS